MLLALSLIGALSYAGLVLRVPLFWRLLEPMSLAQHVVVASAFVGAATVPVILAFLGLGGVQRWHIEAAILFVATFGVLGRLRGEHHGLSASRSRFALRYCSC